MSKKPREVAETVFNSNDYLKEVMNLIPDEKKDTVLSVLGERIMAKDDYSRGMDEVSKRSQAVSSYKETLDSWYGEKAQLLEEAERLKAARPVADPGGSDTLKALEGYIKKDEVEKFINERVRNSEETGLALFPRTMDLAIKHLHEYGQPINPSDVIAFARKNNLSLENGYLEMTRETREQKAADQEKQRIAKMREEIRAEVVKENGHGIFPVANEPGYEGALAGLKGAEDRSSRISSAIDDFYKNSASRRSAS